MGWLLWYSVTPIQRRYAKQRIQMKKGSSANGPSFVLQRKGLWGKVYSKEWGESEDRRLKREMGCRYAGKDTAEITGMYARVHFTNLEIVV